MDGLSILATLTAINNRTTEAFKMVIRDKVSFIDDDWRRVLTVLFSVLMGIASFSFVTFSTDVSFAGTWLEPFTDNIWTVNVLGGFSVSLVSGLVQPLIDRLNERSYLAEIEVIAPEDATV